MERFGPRKNDDRPNEDKYSPLSPGTLVRRRDSTLAPSAHARRPWPRSSKPSQPLRLCARTHKLERAIQLSATPGARGDGTFPAPIDQQLPSKFAPWPPARAPRQVVFRRHVRPKWCPTWLGHWMSWRHLYKLPPRLAALAGSTCACLHIIGTQLVLGLACQRQSIGQDALGARKLDRHSPAECTIRPIVSSDARLA